MKNNKGISIVSLILVILILILIGFLGYEIFYVDILDIKGEELISQKGEKTENRIIITGKQNQQDSNTSSVSPIIDEGNLRKWRKCIY